MQKLIKFPFNILLAISLIAFFVRIYNLNFNSVFIDEAFYIVIGKNILSGNLSQVVNDITWVGGFPFFYPLFSALSYEVGGIVG